MSKAQDLRAELKEMCMSTLNKKESIASMQDRLAREYWAREHGTDPFPEQFAPMLARDITMIDEKDFRKEYEDGNWFAEHKMNGCRGIMFINKDGIRFTSRHRSEKNHMYVEHQDCLQHLDPGSELRAHWDGTILDGELMFPVDVLDTGKTITASQLQAVMALLSMEAGESNRIQSETHKIEFHVFHLIRLGGEDRRTQRYEANRKDLSGLVKDLRHRQIKITDMREWNLWNFYQEVMAEGGEGIMLKHKNMQYQSTGRSKGMLKLKKYLTIDGWISGFVPAKEGKGFEGLVGGIEVSAFVDGKPEVIGVFSNFTHEVRKEITVVDGGGNPQLHTKVIGKIVEVRGQEFSKGGRLVHCILLSPWGQWRTDKPKEECVVER